MTMNIRKGLVYVVFPTIAKDLINRGYRVVDISKDRMLENGTIFHFEDTEEIKELLEKEYNYII